MLINRRKKDTIRTGKKSVFMSRRSHTDWPFTTKTDRKSKEKSLAGLLIWWRGLLDTVQAIGQ